MGWFDEQIRQRIQRDDDMFADAFAQMANLVSGEKILSGLSDDRKLTEEAIGDILRYYHVRPHEVPEQLTDINDVLEYLLRPSGIMRRTVKLSEGWYRDAVGAMLGSKKDGSIIALIPGGAGGYTCKDYATGKTVRINRKNADEISEDAICFYPPFPLRKLRIADLLSYCFRQLRARDYVLMLLQCLLGIVAIILPSVLQKRHNFIIPSNMMILYTLFLYGAIFLGEVMAFYYKVPHWDTILHTFSGAMLGALGYSIISFFNKTDGVPVNMSPAFVAFFAFCFAMTMGMLWEIYEFSVDYFFGTNMQKFAWEGGVPKVGQEALMDTMKDIIVDTVGALVMSVLGYLSLKHKTGFVDKLIFHRGKKHDEPQA